jgi:hypothetical protein
LLLFGNGPNDRRETPDVLSRGTCFFTPLATEVCVGVSSATTDEAVEPTVRFRLRIVTEDGMWPAPTDERGDARGGVDIGAGSLERAF